MALILSHLYVGKKKQWIYWCILIAASILVYSLVRVYNYYSEIQYSVVANSLSPVNLFTAKFSFKVNLLPRICILSIFTFINFRLFFFIYKKSDSENHYTGLIKNWTKTFVILEFVSVSVFGIMNSTLFSYDFGNIMLLFIGYFILLIVLYRPRFINSQGVKVSLTSNFNRDEKFLLTDANFYKPFFINQYYLNEDATLELFCKQNGITSNEFLQNQVVKKYNMTFGNLVNKSRVEYFIELVKSPKYAHYSIEALAKEAGFNSRHHLYKPFKKFHGGTPSDFISSINN
jgi:AraC-like DNA-binding protein